MTDAEPGDTLTNCEASDLSVALAGAPLADLVFVDLGLTNTSTDPATNLSYPGPAGQGTG